MNALDPEELMRLCDGAYQASDHMDSLVKVWNMIEGYVKDPSVDERDMVKILDILSHPELAKVCTEYKPADYFDEITARTITHRLEALKLIHAGILSMLSTLQEPLRILLHAAVGDVLPTQETPDDDDD